MQKKTQNSPEQLQIKLSGEVFSTDTVPILLGDGGNTSAAAVRWGYPGYPDRKNPNRKPAPLINAKSETAATLVTWRDSMAARRCIVPSSGFYEWQHGGAEKTKYLFRLPGESALYMAGVYKPVQIADGVTLLHFAILTTAANESISDVHERMPVVLRRCELDEWLCGNYGRLFE